MHAVLFLLLNETTITQAIELSDLNPNRDLYHDLFPDCINPICFRMMLILASDGFRSVFIMSVLLEIY